VHHVGVLRANGHVKRSHELSDLVNESRLGGGFPVFYRVPPISGLRILPNTTLTKKREEKRQSLTFVARYIGKERPYNPSKTAIHKNHECCSTDSAAATRNTAERNDFRRFFIGNYLTLRMGIERLHPREVLLICSIPSNTCSLPKTSKIEFIK
jgi:hypothetical protein